MKKWILLTFSTLLLSANASWAVQPVSQVDLTRYVGKWNEIASIPQSFQKQCIGNVTAEYSTLDDGKIKVVNSCSTTGERSVSEGRAKVVDKNSNAKLKVTFVKIFTWIYAFGGDYWVINLEPNYRYAVVGHPTAKYGWILARDPSLSHPDLVQIAENLKAQGYDSCKFITTIQDGGINERTPLCDYLKK